MTNDYTDRIDEKAKAEAFDDVLRWIIPSDSDPHASYVVELGSPPGYSVCQCMHFECRLRPLLEQRVTPEEAVARGLVKYKKGARIEDALKCRHILDAEKRFSQAMLGALVKTRTATERRLRHGQTA